MDKEEFAKLVDDTIKDGGVLAMMYFDIHGKDPEGLKGSMTTFISKISVEEGVVYAFGNIQPPIKAEDVPNLYSTMAEVYVLAEDFYTLSYLSLNYAPVSVDILKPEDKIVLTLPEAQKICARLSHFSQVFTNTYLNKVLSPKEKEALLKKLKFREQKGKEIIERELKGKEGEGD